MPYEVLTLTFLGTGAAFADDRYWTSILVNDSLLLDASPIVALHMKKMGKSLLELEHVLISHLHGDHTIGLAFLFCEYAFSIERENPILICGPAGIEAYTRRLVEASFPGDGETIMERSKAQFLEIAKKGGSIRRPGLSFDAYPVEHGHLPCLAYVLCYPGITVGFSGDTRICEGLERMIEESQVIILEMTSTTHEIPGHLNRKNIQEIASRVSPEKTIFVVHMKEKGIQQVNGAMVPHDQGEYRILIPKGEQVPQG